ncbi:30S ribosomal protein S9 [Patescibacteria group bacterium]|nr:30S ribosomal protein S9 [Patescibacteria group bacterium]
MDKLIVTSGKRKTAVARAIAREGTGRVTINKQSYEHLPMLNRLKIEEPLRIAKEIIQKISFDFEITVKGGGEKGQIEAARLALARAILEATKNKEIEKAYLSYDRGLLVADVRRKEAYKPGDSKARRKRQKSFR